MTQRNEGRLAPSGGRDPLRYSTARLRLAAGVFGSEPDREFSALQFVADGMLLALCYDADGTSAVWWSAESIVEGRDRRLDSGLVQVDEARWVSAAGRLVLRGRTDAGTPTVELWACSGDPVLHTTIALDPRSVPVGPVFADDDWLYGCRLEGGQVTRLYRRHLISGSEQIIGDVEGLMQISDLEPIVGLIATTTVSGFNHRTTDVWSLSGLANRTHSATGRRLFQDDPDASTSSAVFGPDGRELRVLSNVGGDRISLRAIDLIGDQWTEHWRIGKATSDLEAVAWSPDRNVAALAWVCDAQPEIDIVSLDDGPKIQRSKPGRAAEVWGLAVDNGQRVATVEAASDGMAYLSLPGEATSSFQRRAPEPEPRSLRFAADDGTSVQGWLHRHGEADLAVVSVHGGPAVYESALIQPLHRYLAQNGCAILAPNYRGSTGFGRAFAEAGAGPKLVDPVQDIEAAGHALQAETGLAAPAVIAHSYGCFLALWALILRPDLFSRAVLLAGVYDLDDYATATAAAWRRAMHIDDPSRKNASRDLLVPVERADEVEVDVLLIHGDQDNNVPYQQSVRLLDRLPGARLVTVHGAGHDLLGCDPAGIELMVAIGDQVRDGSVGVAP